MAIVITLSLAIVIILWSSRPVLISFRTLIVPLALWKNKRSSVSAEWLEPEFLRLPYINMWQNSTHYLKSRTFVACRCWYPLPKFLSMQERDLSPYTLKLQRLSQNYWHCKACELIANKQHSKIIHYTVVSIMIYPSYRVKYSNYFERFYNSDRTKALRQSTIIFIKIQIKVRFRTVTQNQRKFYYANKPD
jgi:hypothetical protein